MLALQACRDGVRSLDPCSAESAFTIVGGRYRGRVQTRLASAGFGGELLARERLRLRFLRGRSDAAFSESPLAPQQCFMASRSAGNDRRTARAWCSVALARVVAKRRSPHRSRTLSRARRYPRDGRSVACCPVRAALRDNSADARRLARAARRRLRTGGGGPRSAGRRLGRDRLEAAIKGVIRADSAFAHYVQRCFEQVQETFSLVAAATQCLRWSAAVHCARESLGPVARLQPSLRRAIPIALTDRNSVTNPLLRAFED